VLDVRMEEAALMSGGNYSQVFTRVTLPLLRPAILSALLLLFVMGMASYEVPRLIGRPARIDVFTTDIQGAIISTPPAFRGRERARPHAARDLHPGRLLLPPRNEARGILRHHHRQGLPADARQARALALAGRRSASARCSPWRSACRCSRWSGSHSSATSRSRSSQPERRRRSRIMISS